MGKDNWNEDTFSETFGEEDPEAPSLTIEERDGLRIIRSAPHG